VQFGYNMVMTTRRINADVRFTVYDGEGDYVYIGTLEDLDKDISMTLHLKAGTTRDEAERVRDYLDAHITKVALQIK
jgi:hypothetical protein